MTSSMKNQRKTPIPDNDIHCSRAASPDRFLRSNNDLNRLNCSMNHQDLINTCIFEQIQGLLFSDLSGPLKLEFCFNKTRINGSV